MQMGRVGVPKKKKISLNNKIYIFGLQPRSWHRAAKTLGISCDKSNKGIICYVNEATFGKSLVVYQRMGAGC